MGLVILLEIICFENSSSTVIVNVTTNVSIPPFAVPPSSESFTVTKATPTKSEAGVNVSVPEVSMDGALLNNEGLLFITLNESI